MKAIGAILEEKKKDKKYLKRLIKLCERLLGFEEDLEENEFAQKKITERKGELERQISLYEFWLEGMSDKA